LPHKRICLEITESHILHNSEKAISTLEELSEKGYSIAIDDFGTGYSSLSHLMSLPANILKIDQSFISNITEDIKSQEITSAILRLSNALDYEVVAEGIETECQLNFVKELNCTQAQGFYFSKALPKKEFIKLLSRK